LKAKQAEAARAPELQQVAKSEPVKDVVVVEAAPVEIVKAAP